MAVLTAAALQRIARGTIGIYRRAVNREAYARRAARAVRASDLDALERLFRLATRGFNDVGANGAGFSIGFCAPAPAGQVFNANAIQGGRRYTAARLRSLSFRVIPLLARITARRQYAERLARAARAGDQVRLRRLIAPYIRRNGLVSVQGDAESIILRIRTADGSTFLFQWFVR